MRSLGDWVQKKTARLTRGEGGATVSEGFVTASLLFCVGAMAIVGALENGLTGNYETLQAKFLYQGSISLLASVLSPLLGDAVIAEMTCVGSLLIVALALNMLNLTKIKVMNLVPAIFLPILLCTFM